jgi:hypothetical protein
MNPRQLAPSAYIVAFLLFAIPFFDAAMSVAPWHFGNSQWRFGAVGLLSNALMIPAAGALIAVVTAVSQGHFRVRDLLGLASWVMAAVVLASLAIFSLDTVQTRAAINPEMIFSYKVASLTACIKLLLGMVTFVLLARACRSSRPVR